MPMFLAYNVKSPMIELLTFVLFYKYHCKRIKQFKLYYIHHCFALLCLPILSDFIRCIATYAQRKWHSHIFMEYSLVFYMANINTKVGYFYCMNLEAFIWSGLLMEQNNFWWDALVLNIQKCKKDLFRWKELNACFHFNGPFTLRYSADLTWHWDQNIFKAILDKEILLKH